jgi:hypothetical protein
VSRAGVAAGPVRGTVGHKKGARVAEAFARVGFFRALHDDPNLPSIRAAVRPTRHPDEARILAYLEVGIGRAAWGGVPRDVPDPSTGRMTSPGIMTDGVWLWPGALPVLTRTWTQTLLACRSMPQ